MIKEIYFAGGCFWGVEKAFKLLNGVLETTVGYINGNVDNPYYELVKTGTTGFKEAVKVLYDDKLLSLNTLLKAFFICIDPSQKDGQKNDIGSQYLTGVYYTNEEDYKIIKEYFNNETKKYDEFYVELKPLKVFYDAEDYHQDYLDKNINGYCHLNKVEYDNIKKLNKVEE